MMEGMIENGPAAPGTLAVDARERIARVERAAAALTAATEERRQYGRSAKRAADAGNREGADRWHRYFLLAAEREDRLREELLAATAEMENTILRDHDL